MTKISRARASTIHNEAEKTIVVAVDDDDFLVPPDAYLQVTGSGLIFLTYAGDAPMLACPIAATSAADYRHVDF